MSVADKLRALDGPYDGATHIRADEKVARGLTLLDALPALIEVVEAAELIFGYIEPENTTGPTVVRLSNGLDALDAALGGEE